MQIFIDIGKIGCYVIGVATFINRLSGGIEFYEENEN